ncbi:MAG TPA: creatininase family protein [Thermoleophilia bacterium]|nr:creatininase family protein [Thermoleophilia bacterium]
MSERVEKHVYREMTWPEVRDVAREDRVVVVPVGTLEDHGPHLPVDTDVRIIEAICERACSRTPDQVVLLPAVTHGYAPHHRDFPGSINIRWDVFVEHLRDITGSLVGHGFRRFVLANGHGSNSPLVNMAARLTIVDHPEAIACDYFYLISPQGLEAVKGVRESEFPGGMAHACELETSIYLALAPALVQMDKAEKDISFPPSDYFYIDWVNGPGSMMEYWSTLSRTGTMGDPTLASAEKGRVLLDAAVDELVMVIGEMKKREIRKRIDHH